MVKKIARVVIAVFDGLRPDQISQELTPNVYRFVPTVLARLDVVRPFTMTGLPLDTVLGLPSPRISARRLETGRDSFRQYLELSQEETRQMTPLLGGRI